MPMAHRLASNQRLALFVLLLIILGLLIAAWTSTFENTLLLAALVALFLFVTRPLWLPPNYGSTRVRLASLWVTLAVSTSLLGFSQHFQALVLTIAERLLKINLRSRWLLDLEHQSVITIATLVFILLAVRIVNHGNRDRTAMGHHPTVLPSTFPERDFHAQRRSFCNVLRTHLNDLNLRTNWSDAHFVPLDAEIEVQGRGKPRKRVKDLISALRPNRETQIFLVLGDPGAGKSVALRKLASQLLNEVERTNRVPIYVNLRNWAPERKWQRQRPPHSADLVAFIKSYLRGVLDVFGRAFVDEYFDRMLEHGHLFLILDSFDEIPAVMETDESSWLISELSAVISATLSGQTRGIVASRVFRRPRLAAANTLTLTILPFSDRKIARALEESFSFRKTVLAELFTLRTELIPVIRNPLAADLLRRYLDNNSGRFPENQIILFREHIRQSLALASDELSSLGLTAEAVIAGATQIAWSMFSRKGSGLEEDVAAIPAAVQGVAALDIIEVLEKARLARVASGQRKRFSFVHRRFHEYFVALYLMENRDRLNAEDIAADARTKDALLLFCEVADRSDAQHVAEFCWKEVAQFHDGDRKEGSRYTRMVHCLRFLSDAFRARPECLADFYDELARLLDCIVANTTDLLSKKHALEATGLLQPPHIEGVLTRALAQKVDWLSVTALGACRYLPRVSAPMIGRLGVFLSSLPMMTFARMRKDLVFAVTLSDSFRGLLWFCRLRTIDLICAVCGLLFFVVVNPLVTAILAVAVSLLNLWRRMFRGASANGFFPMNSLRDGALFSLFISLVLLWLAGLGPSFLPEPPGSKPRKADTAVFAHAEGSGVERISTPAQEREPLSEETSNRPISDWRVKSLEFVVEGTLWLVIAQSTPFILWGQQTVAIIFWIYLFLFIVLLPWYSLVTLRFEIQVSRQAWLGVLGIALLVITLLWGLAIADDEVERRPSPPIEPGSYYILGALAVLVFLVFGIPWLVSCVKGVVSFLHDSASFRRVRESFLAERAAIESAFLGFRTERGRRKFVQWLAVSVVEPTGEWRHGLPNSGNDAASQALARLEERWLGLLR